MLLTACESECHCKLVDGEPNFTVSEHYELSDTDYNLFFKDTIKTYYHVSFRSPRDKGYVGELVNGSQIKWTRMSDGEGVNFDTQRELVKCIEMQKLHFMLQNRNWEVVSSPQRADSIPVDMGPQQ